MAVNLLPPRAEDLIPVNGIELGWAQAGIRKPNRKDLVLMRVAGGASVAAVFTRNQFCAAPVLVCRRHLETARGVRALVINTGNANAGTGEQGIADAVRTCAATAQLLGCDAEQVLPFSTGVILEPLPVERLTAGLPDALARLGPDQWVAAAEGIMTTDTVPKAASRRVSVGSGEVVMTGIAKGAGMIRPNMATMLGFIATDAAVAPPLWKRIVQEVADESFNCITVDGDTSTNDSLVMIATGQSPVRIERDDEPLRPTLVGALTDLAQELARAIVRDGEGATKFIAIRVEQARNRGEASQVAYAIAHSPLVKTAFFASDPNLGRILAAIGNAGVGGLDPTRVQLWLGDVHVARDGERHSAYREEDGQRVMRAQEIQVRVALGRGKAVHTVWTCDFSHEYVSINADYRS